MKTVIRLLVLVAVLLALPMAAAATPPEPMVIQADLYMTGPDTASGEFAASGLFSACGTAFQEFRIVDGTVHGVKTLTADGGTITIRFQALLTPTMEGNLEANGRYVIVSGTGDFARLHGVGVSYALINPVAGTIHAEYEGTAHFD